MLLRFRTSTSDRGMASAMLLMWLSLAMLAMMVLFFRLGDANFLRSNAQTAADAAALAAAAEMKEDLAQRMADNPGIASTSFTRVEEPAEAAAERFAQANNAVLTDIRSSDDNFGFNGNIIRVEVVGSQCRQNLRADRGVDWGDYYCPEDENSGTSDMGNAAAIAEVVFPDCEYSFVETPTIVAFLQCNGTRIVSVEQARGLIDVRLVDGEGRYLHTGEEPDPSVPEDICDEDSDDFDPVACEEQEDET